MALFRKYNEKEEGITQGFAPDAEFPLIYAEKGLLQAYLTGPGTNEFSVKAGGALNVVPDAAPYSGEKLSEVKEALKNTNSISKNKVKASSFLVKVSTRKMQHKE